MSPTLPLPAAVRGRISSIDVLRGLIMIIMALDHVRDFFHRIEVDATSSVATGPTDLDTTTPALFFTRWITHFCAPIFVFLAGTSAFLMRRKRTTAQLSTFLITRGTWLVIVEILIIGFGWTFNPLFNIIILQVIWAIGVSMILLGLLIYLPMPVIFVIGALIVFGHNILDNPSVSSGLRGTLFSDLVYFGNFSVYPLDKSHFLFIVYSFLPWTGVMLLGYCFGKLYADMEPQVRKRLLMMMGGGLLLLFIILRFINSYGDPVPWSEHSRGPLFSFLSFININKYPPSLDFLCVTIGTGMLLLVLFENISNRLTRIFSIYGRVPLFYYILHFYIIHLLVVLMFYIEGYGKNDIVPRQSPFYFRPDDFGYGLAAVYGFWLLTVIILYPLCRWYDRYKTANISRKKWLSYL